MRDLKRFAVPLAGVALGVGLSLGARKCHEDQVVVGNDAEETVDAPEGEGASPESSHDRALQPVRRLVHDEIREVQVDDGDLDTADTGADDGVAVEVEMYDENGEVFDDPALYYQVRMNMEAEKIIESSGFTVDEVLIPTRMPELWMSKVSFGDSKFALSFGRMGDIYEGMIIPENEHGYPSFDENMVTTADTYEELVGKLSSMAQTYVERR